MASKCEILKTSVEFLGQQIFQRWYDSYRGKTEGRLKLGYPKDVNSVTGPSWGSHELLQTVHVQNFAAIANPLTSLTRKDMAWQWGPINGMPFSN